MYDEVIEKIEKMSKLLHFVLIEVSFAIGRSAPVITGFVNYYIFDKGGESFQDVQFM